MELGIQHIIILYATTGSTADSEEKKALLIWQWRQKRET